MESAKKTRTRPKVDRRATTAMVLCWSMKDILVRARGEREREPRSGRVGGRAGGTEGGRWRAGVKERQGY